MRLIFGIGSRLFVWESSVSKVRMKLAGESGEEESPEAPVPDPHGTVNAHCELSPQAIFEGAKAPRRFGFHGSEAPGDG